MNIENLVAGYHAFQPAAQKILFTEKKVNFSGSKVILHRDEIEITWVRESSAFTVLSWKGKIVKRMSTHNDHYGFLTSAETLIDTAPERAEAWAINKDSELEFHVVGYLIDKPTLGFATEQYGRAYYTPVKIDHDHVWRDEASVKDGASFNFKEFPMEVRDPLVAIEHTPTIVWSSARDAEANKRVFDDFRTLAREHIQTIGNTDYRFHD